MITEVFGTQFRMRGGLGTARARLTTERKRGLPADNACSFLIADGNSGAAVLVGGVAPVSSENLRSPPVFHEGIRAGVPFGVAMGGRDRVAWIRFCGQARVSWRGGALYGRLTVGKGFSELLPMLFGAAVYPTYRSSCNVPLAIVPSRV